MSPGPLISSHGVCACGAEIRTPYRKSATRLGKPWVPARASSGSGGPETWRGKALKRGGGRWAVGGGGGGGGGGGWGRWGRWGRACAGAA